MAVRARISILLALLALTFLFATAHWLARKHVSSPVENALNQLRANPSSREEKSSAATALARLGDAALPSLASALKGKDTALNHKYDRWRAKLPAGLQGYFPDRPSKDDLRRAIAISVYDIGPAASRAVVGGLEHGLDPSRGFENTLVLRALYWSIPGSPKAIHTLSNYLAHPAPGLPLFGMKDADEIWPAVPHLAPLLANWLTLADTAGEAAEGLSHMRTNALFAIPQIVELAEKGYVGPPSNSTLHVSYTEDLATNVLVHNKSAALKALGTFHVARPEVLAAIQKNLTNNSPFLRACAANALGELGPDGAPILQTLLANLDETHRMVLRYQLEAIGKMGTAARPALPVLLRFAEESVATHVPDGEPFDYTVRWLWEPLDLPFVAAVAVAKIDLTAAPQPLGAQIAGAFKGGITTNEIIALRPLRAEVLPHLEPSEKPTGRLLAYHTLLLDPGNERAKERLHTMMQSGQSMSVRSIAAWWHFNIFRDTNLILEVFRETLPQVQGLETQTPVTLAGQLGPAARPLIPLLKPILTNDHRIMRTLAGKALRAIAPDQMPPINEN